MTVRTRISLDVKRACCQMKKDGAPTSEIYEYYCSQVSTPPTILSFDGMLRKWNRYPKLDDATLSAGTYEDFTAHDATVQINKDGEFVQAWIKQKANDFDPADFIKAIKGHVEPYNYTLPNSDDASNMLEIPLFDMHWGVAFLDHYKPMLDEILGIIQGHHWHKIVIPFGQDFFHNDSIVNGVTTKGTQIAKVDMQRAVKDGQTFMYALIDTALSCAQEVEVFYTPGNHDRSISWMFIQILLERYGSDVVDDSLLHRKVITYGRNAIMVTHGDSKRASATNLVQLFPVAFPIEFAHADIREIHAGHLHREGDTDINGVRARRLSTACLTDEWSDMEDLIGAHKRFMLFEWTPDKLRSIHYI